MSGLTTNYSLIEAADKHNIPLFTVINKDHFPITWKNTPINSGVIINLADSKQPGTHWVSLWKKSKKHIPCYFDSFGLPPPEIVKKNIYPLPVYYSKEYIQSLDSTVCGYYCLYFIHCMDRGYTFSDFLDQFNLENPKKNLKILKQKFKENF